MAKNNIIDAHRRQSESVQDHFRSLTRFNTQFKLNEHVRFLLAMKFKSTSRRLKKILAAKCMACAGSLKIDQNKNKNAV